MVVDRCDGMKEKSEKELNPSDMYDRREETCEVVGRVPNRIE